MASVYATMSNKSTRVRCNPNNVRIGDIVYLKVGRHKFGQDKEIYCLVQQVCEKSINVSDLIVEERDEQLYFTIDPNNTVSQHFGNTYQLGRKVYICNVPHVFSQNIV